MYKFEMVNVKGGMFKDAYDKATVEVQKRLDEGYKMGWTLVSCQEAVALVDNKGLVFFLVWDTESR